MSHFVANFRGIDPASLSQGHMSLSAVSTQSVIDSIHPSYTSRNLPRIRSLLFR